MFISDLNNMTNAHLVVSLLGKRMHFPLISIYRLAGLGPDQLIMDLTGFVTRFVKTMRTTVRKLEVEEEIPAMRDMTELDLMGIKSEEEMAPSYLERIAISRVIASIRHNGERYEVAVPWRDVKPDLPSNYSNAESHLIKTERALLRNSDTDLAAKYDEIISAYVEKDYLVKLTGTDAELAREDGWFLPHFTVIRKDKSIYSSENCVRRSC